MAGGGGQVVNIASAFGLLPGPLYAAYSATKHGVVGLSRSLRAEGRRWASA
jgi:short-subunit dehydrogenase